MSTPNGSQNTVPLAITATNELSTVFGNEDSEQIDCFPATCIHRCIMEHVIMQWPRSKRRSSFYMPASEYPAQMPEIAVRPTWTSVPVLKNDHWTLSCLYRDEKDPLCKSEVVFLYYDPTLTSRRSTAEADKAEIFVYIKANIEPAARRPTKLQVIDEAPQLRKHRKRDAGLYVLAYMKSFFEHHR